MTVREGDRVAIGRRLAESLGKQGREAAASEMGVSRPRLAQIERGDAPNAWLYLARLAKKGHDIKWILTGE